MTKKTFNVNCPNCHKPIDIVFDTVLDNFLVNRSCWNCGRTYTKLFPAEANGDSARRAVPGVVTVGAPYRVLPPPASDDDSWRMRSGNVVGKKVKIVCGPNLAWF